MHPDYKLFKSLVDSIDDINVLKKIQKIVNKRFEIITDRKVFCTLRKGSMLNKTEAQDYNLNFISIMNDDWDDLYKDSSDIGSDYYVYLHIDPSVNGLLALSDDEGLLAKLPIPFYVGKGKGNRIYNMRRSKIHTAKLRDLTKYYAIEQVAIKFKDGLSEKQALILEAKLILFFGCMDTSTTLKSFSGGKPKLINRQYEPYPIKWDAYNKCNTNSGSGK